ncbi:DUF3499 domain-containing protein [Rhodococcus sp. X156]|uniref:DUF3499 domain-containing protein n=1 Tax=Rhodococcus sp. X156 TaxID=2499145 RepID=UPI000FDA808C|nr:DUF3499 domain-containing protein [Rhodococcus sp. X156]
MRSTRRCSRPGCTSSAVATLTYVYSDSTAVVGPLATNDEPHSYDLCETHATRLTVPRDWEVVRHVGGFAAQGPDDDDLTALAEAVREAGRSGSAPQPRSGEARGSDTGGRSEQHPSAEATTGRRGHLRVLPDPND